MSEPPSAPNPQSPEIIAFATRMYDAARQGDGNAVPIFTQALPAGLPPNMTNDKGDTLLMLASYHNHPPLTRLLLSHGADPNRLNDRGQSPLAGAIFKGNDEIVDLLLEGGADVDLGRPSAMESVVMFKKTERWQAVFERQRQKSKGLELGQDNFSGPGGVKPAVDPM